MNKSITQATLNDRQISKSIKRLFTKIKTEIHQINPYEAYKGADTLVIDEENSMHCDVVIERQITVPIPDVEEYLRKLKGDA